jgi:hypothetical protein
MNILGGTSKTNGLLSRNILRISYGFQWFSMVLNGSSVTYRFENPSEHMFRVLNDLSLAKVSFA